jgi:hypothetical protein
VLRRILFGPRRDEVTGEWSLMISTPHQTLYTGDEIEKSEMAGAGLWGRGEVYTGFLWGNLR